MQRTSYKEMLRNRIPKEVDLGLRWCKSKVKWIDYVYSEFVAIYMEKENRYHAVKCILKPDHERFDFNGNINWDNLNTEEIEHWNYVKEWIDWFYDNFEDIKQKIQPMTVYDKLKYLQNDRLVELGPEWSEKLASYIIKNI